MSGKIGIEYAQFERYSIGEFKVVVDIPLQVFPASKVREEIALLPPPERRAGQEQIRRAIPGLIGGKALTKSGLAGVGGSVAFASAETNRPVEHSVFRVKQVLVLLVPAVEDSRPQRVTADGLRNVILKRV